MCCFHLMSKLSTAFKIGHIIKKSVHFDLFFHLDEIIMKLDCNHTES